MTGNEWKCKEMKGKRKANESNVEGIERKMKGK